jgi:hypothetical protein
MRGPAFHLLQRVYLFRLTVTDQRLLFLLASLLLCAGCGSKSDNPAFQEASPAMSDALTSPFTPIAAVAPAPEKRPVAIEQHGVTRTDDYAWLRDDNWQAVLRDPAQLDADIRTHLNAENAYYKAATDDLRALQETLGFARVASTRCTCAPPGAAGLKPSSMTAIWKLKAKISSALPPWNTARIMG